MMIIQGRYRGLTVILLLLTLLAACSEKITSSGDQGMELHVRSYVGASLDITQASSFILTVSGAGISTPLTTVLLQDAGLLVGSVTVPAGPNRLFIIEAFDDASVLIYSGRTTVDVRGGDEIELNIDMMPEVPMIKLSPVHSETLQGDRLAMKIRGFNLPDISRISTILASQRLIGGGYIQYDDVVINPAFGDLAYLESWADEGGAVHLDLGSRDPESFGLTDGNGFVEIATVYYRTHIYEVSPFETVTFFPTITLMEDRDGVAIPDPMALIYAENSVAILHDYWSRLIASYGMSASSTGNPVPVQDGTQNGHDGIATGTTVIGNYYRQFNGEGDYITVPDADLLDLREGITLSMRIQVDSLDLAQHPRMSIICKRDPEGAINYELLMRHVSSPDHFAEFEFRYGDATPHIYRAVIPNFVLQGWTQAVFSFEFGDPGSIILTGGYGGPTNYEGEWVVGDGSDLPPITNGDLLIGRDNAEVPSFFMGAIDELRIIDHVFTTELIEYYLTGE
ncbi:MAG: LamG domain-containing protein [bacterium]|nr:LamG domain-containing protein [bacterium]